MLVVDFEFSADEKARDLFLDNDDKEEGIAIVTDNDEDKEDFASNCDNVLALEFFFKYQQ